MKICLKLLTIITIISIPSVLVAQKPAGSFIPFSPTVQKFTEIDKMKLNPMPQTAVQNISPSLFMNHLPSTLPAENRKVVIDHSQNDLQFYYNMPVVSPGKTSRILIAELDPKSPYSYSMPVKTLGKKE